MSTFVTVATDKNNVLGLSEPSSVSESALFSFHPLVFFYFMLAFYLVPYPLYRVIAKKYQWETNPKTMARHWSDTMLGFSYGVILFIFGNYSRAFSWITVVAFYPSLFGYALIAEQPYTKTSLPNIKSWPKGMWIVFIIAVGIILAFAGIHIYFATQLALPFVAYYVCGLLIPLFLLVCSIILIKENNTNWVRSKYHAFRKNRVQKSQDVDEAVLSQGGDNASKGNEGQVTQPEQQEQQIQVPDVPHNPYTTNVSLHIHHWQIFYVLAFFTRFTHPVSQVAAGIVLACYMQGICAYGYDPLVNDDH